MACYTSRNCFCLLGEKDRCVCLCSVRGCHRRSWGPGLSLSAPSPQKLHQGVGHPCPPAPSMCRQGSCHETDRACVVIFSFFNYTSRNTIVKHSEKRYTEWKNKHLSLCPILTSLPWKQANFFFFNLMWVHIDFSNSMYFIMFNY